MKRVNYLNNRDLLKEIHQSKNTFCSYVNTGDDQYDLIVKDTAQDPTGVDTLTMMKCNHRH